MLVVETVGKDYVVINHAKSSMRKVWGAKLLSHTEEVFKIFPEKAKEMYDTFRSLSFENPNKIIYLVLKKTVIKHDFIQSGAKKQNLYDINLFAFAFDRDMLTYLPEGWKILDGFSLANSLFEVHTLIQPRLLRGYEEITDFELGEESIFTKLKRKIGFIDETPISLEYSEFASAILEKSNYRVYASVRTASELVDWHKLISLEFEGSLWIPINFSDCEGYLIERRTNSIGFIAEEYDKLLKLYKEGEPLLLSGAILIAKREIPDAVKSEIFTALGYGAIETTKYRKVYITETPLKFLYSGHLFLHTPERIENLFVGGFRKTAKPSKLIKEGKVEFKLPKLVGIDRFGGKVEYSNFDRETENVENPHIVFVAPSGSGKSFKLQQFASEWLKLTPEDLEDLFNGEEFSGEMATNVQIRYFDKGYSAIKLFKLLKARGFDVEIFATKPEEVFFNPLEFGEEFGLKFTNVLLEAFDVEPIRAEESKFFRDLYSQLKLGVCKAWKVKNLPPHLLSLKGEILTRLPGSENYTLCEVAYHLKNPSFCKPIYSDLLTLIVKERGSERYTKGEREILSNLERKIRLLTKTNFNAPTKVNLQGARIFFMDIEELSKWQFFPALMLGILTIFLEMDKKTAFEKGNVATFYIFDEVQNLLTSEKGGKTKQLGAVSSLLETLLREARKYKISVVLATQDWNVFEPKLLQNIATKIAVAGAEKKREEVIASMKHYPEIFSPNLMKTFEEIYKKAPYRTAVVIAPKGIFTLNLPLTQFTSELFSSTLPKLQTPDGVQLGWENKSTFESSSITAE